MLKTLHITQGPVHTRQENFENCVSTLSRRRINVFSFRPPKRLQNLIHTACHSSLSGFCFNHNIDCDKYYRSPKKQLFKIKILQPEKNGCQITTPPLYNGHFLFLWTAYTFTFSLASLQLDTTARGSTILGKLFNFLWLLISPLRTAMSVCQSIGRP